MADFPTRMPLTLKRWSASSAWVQLARSSPCFSGPSMTHWLKVGARYSVSLGAALVSPSRQIPAWVILQAADRALYRAKAGGRDRWELVREGAGIPAVAEVAPTVGTGVAAQAS